MTSKKVDFAGHADIAMNDVVCVCEKCNTPCRANGTIEINFKEKKVFYYCNQCKHMNEITFGNQFLGPMPKTRIK